MRKLTPFKIVFLYTVASLCWIFFSDLFVSVFTHDPELSTKLSIAKGWCFILLTAVFFYSLISMYGNQREESEKKLQESEGRYKAIVDNQSEFICRYLPGGILTFVNDALCKYLGVTRDFLLGKSYYPFMHEEDREAFVRRVESLNIHNPSLVAEARVVLPDGRVAWHQWTHTLLFDQSGKCLEYQATGRDFTAQRQADEARRHSEKLLKAIVDTEPECVKLIDQQGNLLMMNRAGLDMIQAESLEQVKGQCVFPMVTEEYRESFENLDKKVFEGQKGNLLFEMVGFRGRHLWLETHAVPFRNEKDEIVALLGITRDVTEKRKLEEELLQTQKLESLGVLAGGIAHDFNNLLQGIFGYVSVAKKNLDDREKALAMLEQAEKALNMSVNLSRQLLTFSKGGKPIKRILDILPVIENASRFALSGTPSDFQLAGEPGLWQIEADEGQIGQVIQNIVQNAKDALPQGGTVRIAVANVELSPGQDSRLPDGGKFVKISISDDGQGISEESLPRIFDPYFTTKQKGSGLGLATSYSIVKSHNGVIEVKSKVNKGTTFTLLLPSKGTVMLEQASKDSASRSRSGKILIMDDEDMVRNLTQIMIESLGHEVVSVRDGAEAIDRFVQAREAGKPFDIVILDLTVKGGMGGEEAMTKFLQIDPLTKAVVSSGYSDSNEAANFQAHGFSTFLNKPYRIEALERCLNSLLT